MFFACEVAGPWAGSVFALAAIIIGSGGRLPGVCRAFGSARDTGKMADCGARTRDCFVASPVSRAKREPVGCAQETRRPAWTTSSNAARRRCSIPQDWRDSSRLRCAIKRLEQRRRMREEVQLVPAVHRRDPRAGAATATSLAAVRPLPEAAAAQHSADGNAEASATLARRIGVTGPPRHHLPALSSSWLLLDFRCR